MSEKQSTPPDDSRPPRFRITRKRLGTIRFVDPKGEYGFIEAEDFREDVFFHQTVWQPQGSAQAVVDSSNQSEKHRPHYERPAAEKLDPEKLVNQNVEFEIDDELFEREQRLRATMVIPTRRPMGRKLSGRDATFKIVTHHPKARRKRPDWRK